MTKHEELIARARKSYRSLDGVIVVSPRLVKEMADALESHSTPPAAGQPDDTEANRAIADAEDLPEALFEIAAKYGVPVTNNERRWQDGQFLREVGEFIGDVNAAVTRFPLAKVQAGEPEREALASIISITLAMRRLRINPQPKAHEWIDGDIADAILAAGWRRQPEPREVTTVAELDALPVGSIVESSRDGETVTARKPLDGAFPFATDRFWETVGSELGTGAEDLIPARILFTPSTERGES